MNVCCVVLAQFLVVSSLLAQEPVPVAPSAAVLAVRTEIERIVAAERADAERRAREDEEMRVAEVARAKARALREAARPKPRFVDVPCADCRGSGAAAVRCPHCSGSCVEQYKTRKYTEREQQGAYWVVRVKDVRLPCQTCDGVGQVGGECRPCLGRGVRSVENPNR